MVDYLSEAIEHPCFVRIDGRPVVAFAAFSLSNSRLEDDTYALAKTFKELAFKEWGVEPYIISVIYDIKGALKSAEGVFDATTGYCYLPSFSSTAPTIQEYSSRVLDTLLEWEELTQKTSLPFMAPLSLGWDASLRVKYTKPISQYAGVYPHAPIVYGNTPDAIEMAVQKITTRNRSYGAAIDPIFAFNENEEGASLLPIKVDSELDFSVSKTLRKWAV